jgi:very-long-chain (3R)-3-hydroxyacyl-CoA dehydratase
MSTTTEKPKKQRSTPAPVKFWLVLYNVASTVGWSYVLAKTAQHLLTSSGDSTLTQHQTASSLLFSSSSIPKNIPIALSPIYKRALTTFAHVGVITALVQSCAILEVLHVLLGFVRSPLPTTLAQVASRLFLVWGITERFPVAQHNPIYASMVLAWSITEVIRYSFYACTLLGYEPSVLLWLRYTTFYVLYPMGAGSEAALIYSTLPRSAVVPSWQSWLKGGIWSPEDYVRGILFLIWWPGAFPPQTVFLWTDAG